MTMITNNVELDDEAIIALKALCKETRMKPSKAIQAAITAYRRMKANENYLGTVELDLSMNHPSKTKSDVKKPFGKNMNILLDTGSLVVLIVKPKNSKQLEQHETAKQVLKTHG
ncbi:MAG: hypothetical protein NTV43_02500 [Methylococcales bacterium]|nr:hypothetical protein [Methylococcales bacterium]